MSGIISINDIDDHLGNLAGAGLMAGSAAFMAYNKLTAMRDAYKRAKETGDSGAMAGLAAEFPALLLAAYGRD